ncbi:MAG: DUF1553 domain-containing protein [Planctomycetes bacterium]|nr:DUF1553 domain-containing protein [Planctomycetota bacterium]
MLARKPIDLITALAIFGCMSVCSWGQSNGNSQDPLVSGIRSDVVDFVRDVRPIFESHCYPCHGPVKQKSGLRLDVKSKALGGGDHYGPLLDASRPGSSPLLEWVANPDPDQRMPPPGPGNHPLSTQQIEILKTWIAQGASWPEGIDETVLVDPKDHWSFVPLAKNHRHASIDDFVEDKLRLHGLNFSPEASPIDWLRRVSLDLHGLTPDQDLVDWFAEHQAQPNAYETVVDQLLASHHYAERWAQHWLDVVRYADTHGFEVNTPRPHAWHYRDYVIGALNADTPFDEFIRQQIVGDQMGHDTATGFLITASVLLPGQIGADEPSKRLARQDAIDEIVVNIGQAFLGLSIGCARCHDHKFDPITQEDYYAMQGFVAGVEYEDRIVDTPWSLQQRQRLGSIDEQLRQIDQSLLKFEPFARPDAAPSVIANSKENVLEFDSRAARYIKMEIWNANLHPTLGLIEPCIDEFEVWTSGENAKNVALDQHGARASASGSRESAIHKLEHIHDGRLGNASSWMSDQAGRGWILIELANEELISKIVWGRDRLGQFDDRTPTAYRIQIGLDRQNMQDVAVVLPKRSIVQPRSNSDRIDPAKTKSVRFTILDTNHLEPCIDEFEVFNVSGENVALASHGTRVVSSGDSVSIDRHELRLVNDGKYGNSSSWMSNAIGQGSLTFEFPNEQTIDRFVWGRDREGQFQDRLAIKYKIEVLDSQGHWMLVADESDRVAYPKDPAEPKPSSSSNIATMGLSTQESQAIEQLVHKQKQLHEERSAVEENQKAFAGRFRTPDTINLLLRGDPEQPKQTVAPRIPRFFGDLALDPSATESQRRLALADWIASDSNPLTWRVIANRVWQGHFGVGLVETPNDFGINGLGPSHPELLDWLAADLIRNNWSLKSLHRKIVLSRTYRQSSQPNPMGLQIDADARLLWRYPRRRLEAESIRDTILKVCGQLNPKMYGRGYDLFQQRGGLSGFTPIEEFRGDGLKRMIYAHKVRREREAVFGAFDCPDAGQSTGLRRTSTTPIQALNLFNSRFTIDQSAALAQSVRNQVGSDPKACIEAAYQRCLIRMPTVQEIEESLPIVSEMGLEVLCRALLNCNEFLFFP